MLPNLPPDEFATRLLGWYSQSRRDLPWRRNPDPYRVWLAESMLQQTQVKTVLPYFRLFLERFPTLEALAGADEEEVLALWSGLGYYRRARNLLKAARQVVASHQGSFPDNERDALELPGVGRYTAGAVLSIAYNLPRPVLDGNVDRVLSRYLKLQEETSGKRRKVLWDWLEEIMGEPAVNTHPGEFNQALMELGALVCTPTNPSCGVCPLEPGCQARAAGLEEQLPRKSPGRPPVEVHFTVAVACRNGRFLLKRSSGESYLKGFWEFPKVNGRQQESLAHSLFHDLGLKAIVGPTFGTVRHQITFRKLHFHCFKCHVKRKPPGDHWTWSRLEGLPISAYVHKIERMHRLQPDSRTKAGPGRKPDFLTDTRDLSKK